MKPLRLGPALIALAFVINGCGTPRKIHVDGGNDGPDGAKDRVDVPGDQPTGSDVDGSSDVPGEGVVVVPPGSAEKGKPCSTDTDCASGFCRDDVCCADKCEGTCMACAAAFTTLDNGTCGPVVGGMDPRGVCTDQSATTKCGQDGTCDGAGACRKQGPDHVCAPAACSTDGKFTAAGTCDGKGTCDTGMTMACGNVACVITGCAKPCSGDPDCPTGNFCANGTCKIKKIVGEACDNLNQCGSGNCSPDKVCCDTACAGACTACTEALTGQKNGTCAPVQAGKDPKDNCAADDPKSCGHDGTCDGKGGCRYYDSSVACSDPGCTGSTFSPASACDTKGACAPVTPVECGQSMCTPSGCKKMCTSNSDCAAGSYCITATQSCASKKANGIACGGGGECGSGACVDGVCCESACQGKCYACSSEKTGQANGRCLPVTAGSDPDTECDGADSTSCGQDGACDGKGQCRKWASGTQCAAAMCTADNKYVATRTCDGSGTCAPATPDDCGASTCALTGCKRMCNGNQDCTGANYCDPTTKICTAQKNMGAACKMGVECVSQSCVDGVCCESACASKCYACSNDKTGQTSGRCQPITSQTDPDNECDSADQTTCGQDGTCDGNGQCRKWNPGTMCGAASCAVNQYQPSLSCDGNGTCSARPVQDCGGATCDATGCKASCANDGECFGNSYCDLVAHRCAAKKNLGSPCGTTVECLSLFCADGVCCNSACNGKCNACIKEKTGLATSGTCGAIPAGSDPDNECTASDASTCGLDGSCDGSGQCRQWSSGTQCAAGMCASNAYTAPRTCDGQGTCGAKSPKDCTPSTCGANGCKVSCATAADCTSGNYCDASMMCAPLKSLGGTCTTTTECLSGICADGVCCNTACDRACQACNLTNSKGTCTPVSGNPPAGHPTCAGADSGCNGTCAGSADGQCAFPTTSCGTCKACMAGSCKPTSSQTDPACSGTCQTCTTGSCVTVKSGSDTDSCSGMCDATGKCQPAVALTLAAFNTPGTDFGSTFIPGMSYRYFTLTNSGYQASMPVNVSITGQDFLIYPSANNCISGQTALGPGLSCDITVIFRPTTVGNLSATLSASAAGAGSP
ncbi:MAG: hypothetical protein QOI66_1658, partial [Myxococcales bacterium]|nr:hypothetical protein [Myxococcales bacterium]